MSSTSSPPLIVDVRDRPAERWVGYGAIATAAILPFGALPFETHSNLLLSSFLSAAVLVGLRACRWLGGPGRIVHVAGLAERRWLAGPANGASSTRERCQHS